MIGRGLALVVLMHDLRRLLAVDPHMLLEVSTLAESFAADLTDVGPFSGVQAGVDHHLVPLGEGFVAKLTLIRSGVGVNPLVFSHQIPPLEVFGTVSTLIGPFACMNDTVVQSHF